VDKDFSHPVMQIKPSLFNQSELNDLIRDLDLSKQSSKLMTSRLHAKHLLKFGTSLFIITEKRILSTILHLLVADSPLPCNRGPLIQKPHCLTPTHKFRNGYVILTEKKAQLDYANCHLVVHTMHVAAALLESPYFRSLITASTVECNSLKICKMRIDSILT